MSLRDLKKLTGENPNFVKMKRSETTRHVPPHGLGGAAPGATPTNAVITAVKIRRKILPLSFKHVSSDARATPRRDFTGAYEAARACEVPTWRAHALIHGNEGSQ